MQHIAVVTTVGDMDQGRRLARTIVERGLAACVRLIPAESFFVWKDEAQQETETQVVIKTTHDLYDALEAAIVQEHPYELPAIYATALCRVYEPYGQWVIECTAAARSRTRGTAV